MAKIISFDSDEFKKLYNTPVKYMNKRAKLIWKACEIWHNMKQKAGKQ